MIRGIEYDQLNKTEIFADFQESAIRNSHIDRPGNCRCEDLKSANKIIGWLDFGGCMLEEITGLSSLKYADLCTRG
jgi:hypothetical protein